MGRFNLSRWAVEHQALVGFLIALLFSAGAIQFSRLGRAEDPGFTLKEMVVSAQWPGASAERMQRLVAHPLELTLRSVESVDTISTTCMPDACIARVALLDDAPPTRVPLIWQQVRRKITDLAPGLPHGATLAADDDYSDVYGYLFALTGGENIDLTRAAEAIRDRMMRVKGVGKVRLDGEVPQAIHVVVDLRRLAASGTSIAQVAQAVEHADAVAPAGSVDLAASTPIRVGGAANGLAAIEAVPIPVRDGLRLRLRDIATVSRGYADPPPALVRYDGRPAVVIAVGMAPGSDGLAFGKALHAVAVEAAANLPAGLHLTQIEDQRAIIRESVDTFLIKFAVALTVVLIVSFVVLGLRTGVVVAISVPLTLAITAIFMGVSGIGLERVSLGALILSLGLLVDDAIISVEAMVVQMEKGASRADAASYAWTHTAFPMLTGTMLTVVSFLPVGLAGSTTGEYASDIFWVAGAALLVSWVVAVVFVPFLGVRLLPDGADGAGHSDPHDRAIYRRLRTALWWTLSHRRVVAASVVLLLALSGGGVLLVREQLFPLSDRPELIVDVAMKPGTAIGPTGTVVAGLERRLVHDPDVRHLETHIGEGVPRFYLPYAPAMPDAAHATLLLVATDLAARERLVANLAAVRLPIKAQVHVQRLSLGPSADFPVQFRVLGPDAARLRTLADRVATVLRRTPGTSSVQLDWGSHGPALAVDADAERLATFGTDRAALAGEMQALASGVPAGEVPVGDKRIGVLVRTDDADHTDPGHWPELPVTTGVGAMPLGQLAGVHLGSELPVVRSRDGDLSMTVQSDVKADVKPSEIVSATARAIAGIRRTLPPGYRLEVGGDAELSATANEAIYRLLPVTLGIMLLLLMVQLQSIGRTLMVLATASLGLIGAVSALLVTGAPFGFVALLGLIALAGMIMRNTIILVDQIERNRQDGSGLLDAIVEATITRSRPVVLTALAAILAFVPLAFNIFWGPMAIVMIGGLIGATALTLFALPAFYALVFEPRAGANREMSHAR